MLPPAKPYSNSTPPARASGSAGHIGVTSLALASSVPSRGVETDYAPPPVFAMEEMAAYDINHPRMQVYHPDLAPSAQTTEAALMARSLLQQSYAQNAAATRMAQMSNSLNDAPRFSHSLNIMA